MSSRIGRGKSGRFPFHKTFAESNLHMDLKFLRIIRKRLGLNAFKAAEQVGVGRYTFCRWEKGENLPPLPRFKQICKIFQLDPFEICDLLKIELIPRAILRKFRVACERDKKKPLEAVIEFMRVYSAIGKSGDKQK
jgi:DNA-binding XRE family transcriptional regulator